MNQDVTQLLAEDCETAIGERLVELLASLLLSGHDQVEDLHTRDTLT